VLLGVGRRSGERWWVNRRLSSPHSESTFPLARLPLASPPRLLSVLARHQLPVQAVHEETPFERLVGVSRSSQRDCSAGLGCMGGWWSSETVYEIWGVLGCIEMTLPSSSDNTRSSKVLVTSPVSLCLSLLSLTRASTRFCSASASHGL
jgi:hypothetical protein